MFSSRDKIESMMRVNHAGEYGAKRIYEGQLAVLKRRGASSVAEVEHMKMQELKHLEFFENEIISKKIRPTILQPMWHIAGFALGAATALMGEKAAHACTVAVEEVINDHYNEQISELTNNEELTSDNPNLKEKLDEFRLEELEHRQKALDNKAEEAPLYPVLTTAIKLGSHAAIWLAKRF